MASKGIRLLDGSFSTALAELGFNADDHKLWTAAANKLEPEKVQKVYEGFLKAGVDIITTNTYHASESLIRKNYKGYPEMEYNLPAFKLLDDAIEAVKPTKPVEILGSIGCYGSSLRDGSEYTGAYVNVQEYDLLNRHLTDYYFTEIHKMQKCGAKKIIIETVPTFHEVPAIIDATELEIPRSTIAKPELQAYSAFHGNFDCEYIVSFACKDGKRLNHGEPLAACVEQILTGKKIKGVGINCTAAEHISSLLDSIQGITGDKQVFVYPNEGYGKMKLNEMTEEELRDLMVEWIDKGATVIGGCCGISTETIRKMRKILDSM